MKDLIITIVCMQLIMIFICLALFFGWMMIDIPQDIFIYVVNKFGSLFKCKSCIECLCQV
jgi:hypothetical protein